GFLKGSGHGSTMKDKHDQYWHFATMAISVNFKFERRLGMFPAGFEEDGQMYVNTTYGDYPHFLPDVKVEQHKERFSGWMLLSKDKEVKTNSTLVGVKQKIIDEREEGYMPNLENEGYAIRYINDENLRTMWVAESNSDTIQFEMDLGSLMSIHAIQINFLDFNADLYGRKEGIKQQFVIEGSIDGTNWSELVDFSENQQDRPHAYIELEKSESLRFIKFQNLHFPNKYLAIGEFRVFGKGNGAAPKTPKNFRVARQKDQRNAGITWDKVKDAQGYVLRWGIRKDRLNNSVMIYDENTYELRALNLEVDYFYQVEAFNENGISKKSKILSDI
ncbi:MAG: discoidin domain-containing protein, partial [Bacteroidota bacterium]